MEKQAFDFEAFKKQAHSRIKNGETLLGTEGVRDLAVLYGRNLTAETAGKKKYGPVPR